MMGSKPMTGSNNMPMSAEAMAKKCAIPTGKGKGKDAAKAKGGKK